MITLMFLKFLLCAVLIYVEIVSHALERYITVVYSEVASLSPAGYILCTCTML